MNDDPNLNNGGGSVNDPHQTGHVQDGENGGNTDGQGNPHEDYETKFRASASEANRMRDVLIKNGIDPKTGERVAPPADQGTVRNQHLDTGISIEEISKEIPGFEFLSPKEQANVIAAKQGGQRMEQLFDMVAQIIDRDKFAQQLDALTANPTFAALRNDPDFKAFAYSKDNLGTPLEVLAGSYLFNKKGTTEPEPIDGGKNDRPGLTTGSGGDRSPGNDGGKLNQDEIAHIRKRDPQRYMRMIQSGEIRAALSGK